MPKKIYSCTYCTTSFARYASSVRNEELVFCSREHKVLYFRENNLCSGENNNNYGNKWSDEQRKLGSIRTKKIMEDPAMRFLSGSANRGKKFSDELIERMHGHRDSASYSHPHTEESKILIGQKSKEKWTEEYKEENRRIREELGYWIPLDQKSNYEIYFKESDWIEHMFNRASDEERQLLKEHGVFNARTNSKGVVRDHCFSRRSGCELEVFPELLHHPVNCQIITHSDNVKKKVGQYTDKDSITLNELFDGILNFDGEWKHQSLCLELIDRYNMNERWKRKE